LARQAQKEAVVAEVEKRFGKPFPAFTDGDYARFVEGLDLKRSDDLLKWSHVTGIPIIAVKKGKEFGFSGIWVGRALSVWRRAFSKAWQGK
jgi:hypothetical protein